MILSTNKITRPKNHIDKMSIPLNREIMKSPLDLKYEKFRKRYNQ